jgi:hypothetical protein
MAQQERSEGERLPRATPAKSWPRDLFVVPTVTFRLLIVSLSSRTSVDGLAARRRAESLRVLSGQQGKTARGSPFPAWPR